MDELQRAIQWLEETEEESIAKIGNGTYYKQVAANCRALLDALRWVPVATPPPEETAVELYACGLELAFLRNGKWLRTWDMSIVNPAHVTRWRPLPEAPPKTEPPKKNGWVVTQKTCGAFTGSDTLPKAPEGSE